MFVVPVCNGYMYPEYAMHGEFSEKSNVYSFGILVLEIISDKKNSNFESEGAEDLELCEYEPNSEIYFSYMFSTKSYPTSHVT